MEFKAFKMDGLGNDFVIIETKKRNPISISKEKIIELGKRDSIGFDQMIFVEEDDVISNHASIKIFNSDGDEVDACGNGSRCVAKIICDNYNGKFPDSEKELLNLPGIGSYTAAAIISIAFNKPAIVIDGNIQRIISRLYEIKEDLKKSKSKIYEKLEKIISKKRPGDFAQALMDLGSTICKPINPLCNSCPVCKYCLAHKNNTYKFIPLKTKKLNKVIKKGYLYIGITTEEKIILIKRPKKGLLSGTICPPSSDWKQNEFPTPKPPFKGDWKILNESIFHSITHFDLELKIMISKINEYPNDVYLEPLNSSTLKSLPTVMKKGVALVTDNQII